MSELPEGWEYSTLQELGLPKTTNVDPKSFPEETFELYSVPSYSYGTPEIVKGSEIGSTKQLVQPGDVLLCKIVPHLVRVWVVPERKAFRQIASGEWILVRPSLCNASYIRRLLMEPSFRDKFMDTVSGVGGSLLRARPKSVSQIPIPVAPVNEQRRIVAKLDSLFERTRRAREELSHIPRLIENYKKAILEAAIRGDLTKDLRDRGFTRYPVSPRDASAIKKKYRGSIEIAFLPPYAIPDEWRWFRLPELGDLDRGKSKHRPRNDPTLYGGDFPFVQTGEVREATRYLRNYSKTYNDKGLSQSRLWPVGTVCITIAANIAETAILDIDACFPDSVVGFIADKDRVSNSYIEFFLRTMKDDLEAFAPATAQKNINLDTLSSVYVPVPPLNEQIEIVNRIEKAMDWLKIVEEEQGHSMHLLDRLDQANLAKAFRGELVSQDPNDEPASVLLDRIRAVQESQPKTRRSRFANTAEESCA